MPSRFLTFALFGIFSTFAVSTQADPLASSGSTQHFPAIKLRAFGTLAGEQKTFAGSPQSSLLTITCDNEDKAKLVLAKYLSDLLILPGLTPLPLKTEHGAVTAHLADNQGAVAAIRTGSQVLIFTAIDGSALTKLINTHTAGAKIDASEPEVDVPMYVDRWDKYGFRFYYGPFTRPHDGQGHDVTSYDPRQDFAFADKNDKTGLVLWNSPLGASSADGIMDVIRNEWIYKAAQPLKLPLGINIGITDQNVALSNRFPNGIAPAGGPYIGGWYYESFSGIPTMAWSSRESQEASLSQLKNLVVDLNGKYDNIVNWLEPHEETSHGIADLLDDHGADARKNFYEFLRTKYGSVGAVAKRYGANYADWKDIPFPELATFFGFQGDAINLAGWWKASTTAPYDASSAKPDLDDSSWPDEPAPEHAIVRWLPRKPTILRRHLAIDPAWRAAHPKAWLYVWDLENTSDIAAFVYVNGQLCPENPPMRRTWHFSQVEITPALKDGDNLITLELPVGVITYRAYITGEAPAVYPALATTQMNARYADFSDWCSWSRGQAVRRGMQMIRQVDPDKPITLMSPGYWWNDYKDSVEDYGAILHDTGGMAGFWNDINPSMAQSTGLPTDCEPGGPAATLDDFKKFMGRWETENTQGVDYFGHLGDVLWNPAIKDYFEKTQPLWHIMGKYHLPQPEVAELASVRTERLFSFPFNLGDHGSSDPDLIAVGPGVFASGVDGTLANTYSRGNVIEGDFKRGIANQYKVIVDTNSSILDPDTIDAIGKWVERGGIFITFEQTGRHSSTQHDTWPISKLTGYKVLQVDHANRAMSLASGQATLPASALAGFDHNWGLSMQKIDPKCQDIVLWDNGTVAAGVRHIGKGQVIDFGMFDSLHLIVKAIDGLKIKHVPGEISNGKIIMHSFVTNNGLYDVWTMWNTDPSPQTTDLLFHDGLTPLDCHDLNTGDGLPITTGADGAKITGIAFEPLQTRVFLTARNKIADAPAEWFHVQRNWWKGTASPGAPMAAYKTKLALDLTDDNAFKVLAGDGTTNPPEDPSLSDVKTDDATWPKRSLGIFDIPDNGDAHHAVFRKHFTIPADWNHGHVYIFGKCEMPSSGGIRRYMDGKPFGGQIVRDELGGIFKPGSTHIMTTEFWGPSPPLGTNTPAWIYYIPDPVVSQKLDSWNYARDFLTYSGAASSLPLTNPDSGSQRCEVVIDPREIGKNVVIHVMTDNAGISGMIFNGNYYASYGNIYNFMDINVTPFVKYGQKNEVLVLFGNGPTKLEKATLDFYDKNTYP